MDKQNITDSQKICLLKLRHGHYMRTAMIQFGREAFPSIACPICNSPYPDTWLHVLLNCKQHHIHALQTKRHDKVVWELRKLIVASKKLICYVLMNACTFNNDPLEYTVPPWLLPCTCGHRTCHCYAKFKPNILCVKGLPYQSPPPTKPIDNLIK